MPFLNPILKRCNVCRGVSKTTVGLSYHEWRFTYIWIEHHRGAFTFLGDPAFQQIFDDARKLRIVKTLPKLLVKMDAKPLINPAELLFRKINAFLPDLQILRISLLEFD